MKRGIEEEFSFIILFRFKSFSLFIFKNIFFWFSFFFIIKLFPSTN